MFDSLQRERERGVHDYHRRGEERRLRLCEGIVVVVVELRHAVVVRAMRNATFSDTPGEEPKDVTRASERPTAAPTETHGSLWYEIADDHSVLEFRPAYAAGSLLALHVVIDSEADATIAWWETENGMCIAHVGCA
jgi:hypothetical protein